MEKGIIGFIAGALIVSVFAVNGAFKGPLDSETVVTRIEQDGTKQTRVYTDKYWFDTDSMYQVGDTLKLRK